MKKLLRVISLCILAALLCSAAVPAFAATQKAEMPQWTFWAGEGTWCIHLGNWPDNAKLVSVKSSKPEVLEVNIDDAKACDIAWAPKKIGKSKVTVTYKVGKKKTTVSATYAVKKIPDPFTTLKINGKSIKSKLKKTTSYYFQDYAKNKVTITYQVKKGWKVFEHDFEIREGDRFEFKSGKSLKIPKGKSAYAVLGLENTKTGDRIIYFIHFDR